MASPSELTLDFKPHHHSYSMLLKSFGDHHHTDQAHIYKLQEFVSRLEEERLKIDAFKRELPLCMQLLTNAMEASRQQLEAYRGNQGTRPAVLEEFIPLKHSTSESSEKASSLSDKANWMTSAQLWSQTSEQTKPQSTVTSGKEAEIGFNVVSPKLTLDSKKRNGSGGGGAFLPFSKEPSSNCLPELSLASAEKEMMKDDEEKKCPEPENPKRESSGGTGGGNGGVGTDHGKGTTVSSEPKTTAATAATTQTHRKPRRCWSPDLHRRFVNALQMLGGSQVATPKQIRELMKVDGLTNDEVKSHLQKYRLHTRRPSPSPQAAGAPAPQLVVLGGFWVPPEYAAHTGAANALFSPHPASHAPPPHYCTATPVPQDFYAAAPPQPHSQALHHHHLHMYRTTSHTQRLPECEVGGAGERLESIEDGKSESSSWKQGESGENEGGRKGLAALRENGEESNGSEITLKF